MAEQPWDEKLLDFMKKTGEDLKRTGEEFLGRPPGRQGSRQAGARVGAGRAARSRLAGGAEPRRSLAAATLWQLHEAL